MIEAGKWFIEVNNHKKAKATRRWYLGTSLTVHVWHWDLLRVPVSGGALSVLSVGPLRIWWGGWRALNWN